MKRFFKIVFVILLSCFVIVLCFMTFVLNGIFGVPLVGLMIGIFYYAKFAKGTVDFLQIVNEEWEKHQEKESGHLNFGLKGNNLPDYQDIKYFRDIPFSDELSIAYWVCLKYNIVLEPDLKKGLLGAIILKWIKEEKIKVTETRQGLFSFQDNNYAIDLTNLKKLEDPTEKSLYQLLLSISGDNQILEANEFKNWCYYNYDKLNGWFFYVRYNGQKKLEEAKFITTSVEKVKSKYGAKKTIVIKNVKEDLWYEALKLKGLKKFLMYFTLMDEKEFIQVHLWEEYLIFSSLLDVSQKVKEQFGKIYPKIQGVSGLNIDTVNFGIGLAELGYVSFEKGYDEANEKHQQENKI